MSDQVSDPLLHDLVQQIPEFDRARVGLIMDMFSTTIDDCLATKSEVLWAVTGVLVALIRSTPAEKLDLLGLAQRMITLRMTWGEHIDAKATPAI